MRVEEACTVRLGDAEFKASIDEHNLLRLSRVTTANDRRERRLDLALDQENELDMRRQEAAALTTDQHNAVRELDRVSEGG